MRTTSVPPDVIALPKPQASQRFLVGSTLAAGLVLGIWLLYSMFLRRSAKGPTRGFNRLRSKPPGSGNGGKDWKLLWDRIQPKSDNSIANGGGTDADAPELTWLGDGEMLILEALGDTLLPGFEVGRTEDAKAVAEQVVKVVEARMFRGEQEVGPTAEELPPALRSYIHSIAVRCRDLHGRPGSHVGVARLVAKAYEANIPHEQRSGLRVLLWALNTRVGAFLLTGRAVPLPSQDLASRHALLRRWSVSRIEKFREAFQGVKRLTCSLYFSAHPDVPAAAAIAATTTSAVLKDNPNWHDIRYEPQHHRLARDSSVPQLAPTRSGLWSGTKVKVAQVARAAAAVSSPSRRTPTPPSPPSSATASSATKFFSRPRGASFSGCSTTAGSAGVAAAAGVGSSASSGNARGRAASAAAPPASEARDRLPSKLVVDVVIVGSGAGGGCAAGVLASKGLKVAVLEKGGLYDERDFAGFSEMEAYQRMYERQGVLTSSDAAMVILAGSCVGGGTTVNWTASFRTPRHVRLEWARKLGLKKFEPGGPYDKALDAVCERLGVNTDYSHRAPGCPAPESLSVNQHQSSLWNGAVACGRTPKPVPRNAKGCVDCGSCLHGCASGNKRSTHTTWLRDGLDSGNITLIPHAKVDRVLMDGGRATGVIATVNPAGVGKGTPLEVQARAVVVSGGAIHTPAILLRSGLKHPLLGRHLCLHPVLVVGGVFPEDYKEGGDEDERRESAGATAPDAPPLVFSSVFGKQSSAAVASKIDAEPGQPGVGPRVPSYGRGVMMGVYVQDWMGLDEGYGCVIEAPPVQPGLMGLVMPWNDGLSHRLTVAMLRETSTFLCIGRDRSSRDNRVELDPRGEPVINYKLGEEDASVILRGRTEMMRLLRGAGASMLLPAHEGAPWLCTGVGKEADERFEQYLDKLEDLGAKSNEAGLFSAHQMGSCRLSATREGGPLRETGESWECDGLFVADASIFPTSIGINPMITVEATAYMVADEVATRLGKEVTAPPSRPDSSPLRRRFSKFGRAVAIAMSRDTTSADADVAYDNDSVRRDAGALGSGRDASDRGRSTGVLGAAGAFSSGRGTVASGSGGGRCRLDAAAVADDYGVDLSW